VLPVGDFLRRRTTPYVNWVLLAVNIAVFIYTLSLDTTPLPPLGLSEADEFYFDYGGLPACIAEDLGVDSGARPRDLALCPEDPQPLISVFSSMFLHAGWLHIVGNMLFLWIFGDNVEDRLGHVKYVVFYFASGIAAMAAQVFFSLDSVVPTVGASGAIAGVMGAYVFLFPKALVRVIVMPLFFFPFYLPAAVLIGFWFLTQLLGGIADLGQTTGTNIAWWAHIGGFVAGVVLLYVLGAKRGEAQRTRWREDF
jgi:membrane associated rhomboid family serine protease